MNFNLPELTARSGTDDLRAYLVSLTRQLRIALDSVETDAETASEEARLLRENMSRTDETLSGAVGKLGVLGRHQVVQSNEPPENAAVGTLWLDTSGEYPAYRRFDGEAWTPITDYEKLAGQGERITAVEEAVSEAGLAHLVSKSTVVAGAVKDIVSTAFLQGADGMEARMTRVEQGMRPVTDWIRWTAYEGETGLMIGTDTSSVWIFITNSALRIMNGSDTAASFALKRAAMNDAVTANGITLGEGENALRIDRTDAGTIVRPE